MVYGLQLSESEIDTSPYLFSCPMGVITVFTALGGAEDQTTRAEHSLCDVHSQCGNFIREGGTSQSGEENIAQACFTVILHSTWLAVVHCGLKLP